MHGFNPRARVGRDEFHMPTLHEVINVSIHAPAWGATYREKLGAYNMLLFQSTRPRGARPPASQAPSKSYGVSIHAPAWGATFPFIRTFIQCVCFNPRARVGRDFRKQKPKNARPKFQSTRPRGARLGAAILQDDAPRVSIHAPAWGATNVIHSGA